MAAPMSKPTEKSFRVLELYSGIGGMHYALKEAGLGYKVVQAIDVNTNANKIYRLNFPDTDISSRGIEGLSVKALDKLDIDMILMSPPCQPFTRVGKKQDAGDARTKSFLHLLDLIPRLKKCPSYILVENVKGFDVSETRDRLIEMLEKCQYTYQEMLLSPLQFGIPNSRLRYYLIAKQSPLEFIFGRTGKVIEAIPNAAAGWLNHKILAQSTQHQCVCHGYCGYMLRSTVSSNTAEETGSIADGNDAVHDRLVTEELTIQKTNDHQSQPGSKCVSLQSDSLHQVDDRLVTEERSIQNTNDNPSQTDSKNVSLQCDDKCNKESENMGSQTQTSAKRLKTADKNETKLCDLESIVVNGKTNCDIVSSADCIENRHCLENYGSNMRQEQTRESFGPCLSLSHFLEDNPEVDYFKPYFLTEDMLQHFIVMDVINPCSRKSSCFTKRYGKFVNGAGSVLQMAKDIQVMEQASLLKDQAVSDRDQIHWSETELSVIRSLQLRYFTPREIANFLCFPKSFNLPRDLTNRQLYMLLGNSLNVHVVSVLIRLMVAGDMT